MAADGRRIRSYRDLEVWRRAVDLVVHVYRVTKSFPSEERYGLTSPLRRSTVSVASNIAEGRGRQGLGGFLQHLSIANGSLMEMETQLIIGVKLGFLSDRDAMAALQHASEVGRMLAGLMRALRRRRIRYQVPGT